MTILITHKIIFSAFSEKFDILISMRMRNEVVIGSVISLGCIAGVVYTAQTYQTSRTQVFSPQYVTTGKPIQLTTIEIAKHNIASDCWMIVNDNVYDVTTYLPIHPGGADRISNLCGADGTTAFTSQGGNGSHSTNANRDLAALRLGTIDTVTNTSIIQQIQQNTVKNITPQKRKEYEDD